VHRLPAVYADCATRADAELGYGAKTMRRGAARLSSGRTGEWDTPNGRHGDY
jgi:hypothetical protein